MGSVVGLRFPLRVVQASVLLALSAGCGSFDPSEQETEPEGEDVRAAPSSLDITVFDLPPSGKAERAAIVAKYPSLDPTGVVPRGLLEDAIEFFDLNKAHIPKQKYFVVVDFAPFSGKDRFFLVNVATGVVEPHKVAHGDGTDPDNDGNADYFSNKSGSHMSSLGFYLTGEIYDGTHPHSMRIDGLSPDGSPNGMANTNVRDRLVVVHEASYVDDAKTSKQGRSNGCFALDPSIEVGMVDRIHDGTLMYAATSPLNPPVGPGAGGSGGTGGSGGAAGSGAAGGSGGAAGGGAVGGATGGAAGGGGAAGSGATGVGGENTGGQSGAAGSVPTNEPPPAAGAASSDDGPGCGAASVAGSKPESRPSAWFMLALALGLGARGRRTTRRV
ncbi:MAG: murein L,D-transpeptidase catalytic domain family protein [Polyangiaceae bacterium]